MPVHRDPELASALAQLSLGQEVPEAMWTAVAEVLAWAYGLSGRGPYPKPVMKDIGSAPDTAFVRQSVSPSQERSSSHEAHDVLRQPPPRFARRMPSRCGVSTRPPVTSRCATAWS